MRSLVIGAALLLIVSIILLFIGLSGDAPGVLAMLMFCTGPAFFIALGAVLGRLSRDYTLVPKGVVQAPNPRATQALR